MQKNNYIQKSQTYREVDGEKLAIEIFSPSPLPEKPAPAILFFHGGGWVQGNRSQFFEQCAHLAQRGMVALSADYRLGRTDAAGFRQCVEDVREAMRWTKTHGEELGVDPDRVLAGGGSAGGHLALSLLLTPEVDGDTPSRSVSLRPAGWILFNPAVDLGPETPAHKFTELGADWKTFSPRQHLREGLPPLLILTGEADEITPLEDAQLFIQEARALGTEAELLQYPGQPHGFFNNRPGQEKYFHLTLRDLDAYLVRKGFLPPRNP